MHARWHYSRCTIFQRSRLSDPCTPPTIDLDHIEIYGFGKEPKRMEPEDTNGLKLLLVEIYTGISERHLDHDNDSCNYGEDDMTLEMAIMIDLVFAGGRLSCLPPSTAWCSSSGASAAKSIIAISSSSSLGQSRPSDEKAWKPTKNHEKPWNHLEKPWKPTKNNEKP